MENLPVYICIVFELTTILTLGFFYKAARNSKITLFILLSWLVIQAFIGLSGFYTQTTTVPPRFLVLILPPMLCIVFLFLTAAGRKYMDAFHTKTLVLLHVVRLPVEIVLFWLFKNEMIPGLMTFEGRNFDILSGLTAPFIYYFGFIKNQLSSKIILFWNFTCLCLLVNIVTTAILSAPFSFQRFAFDQPNVAILYFPFTWLPCCVVPLVLLSHLIIFRHLLVSGKNNF